MNKLELTKEECEIIIEVIDWANTAVIHAWNHGVKPFQTMDKERYEKNADIFKKIREFAENG